MRALNVSAACAKNALTFLSANTLAAEHHGVHDVTPLVASSSRSSWTSDDLPLFLLFFFYLPLIHGFHLTAL